MRALAARHRDEVAAIVVEPILQGAGGMYPYSPACLRLLRELADEYGFLLILDEIATGFGRTGELFAAQHAGVVPDILCVGKALTGGYLTLAATLCTGEVARTVSAGEAGALLHGPTFMANPLACAAANASLGILATGAWREDVARVGASLTTGLTPALKLDAVADVRTLGAVGVIELTDAVDVAGVTRAAVEHGVWIRPFRNLVYAMPPYISSTAEVDVMATAMVAAVEEAAQQRAVA